MSATWYDPASFYLLRVPAFPFMLFETIADAGHLDPVHGQGFDQAWHDARLASLVHLKQLASHPLVELAMLVASPSLSDALRRLPQQPVPASRRDLRAYERLLQYLIRMSSRPTPFGYYAGVSFGSFASESQIVLEHCEGCGIRPDMRWLAAVIASIEEQVLPALEVQVIPDLLTVGTRGIGFKRGLEQHDERVWFSLTAAFERCCHYARTPLSSVDLLHALLTDFPQATKEQIEGFLRNLYQIGVLITTLPPVEHPDPFDHILDSLRPSDIPSEVMEQLKAIQEAMQAKPRRIQEISLLIQQQRPLTPGFEGVTIQVDTRLQMQQNRVSSTIGQEAARAAETLLRLSLYPSGLPSLHSARRLFLERYEEQEVPLLSLFAPQGGFDTLYEQDLGQRELPLKQQERLTQRTHVLRTLAMQAVNARQSSLELTDDLVERLSLWSSSEASLPPLLDVYMHLFADSLAAIDRGDWQGFLPLLSIGGRAYRRFWHIGSEREQAMVHSLLQAEAALFLDTVYATLAFIPAQVRDLNVMHGPLWSRYVIPLNCSSPSPPAQTIHPSDLFVCVRNGRFCLRSRSHNKAVRVSQHHMLSFLNLPPLARFLLEASRDEEVYPGPFQWGTVGRLPFLPRLTRGKIVVSLAQWRLSCEMLACGSSLPTEGRWFHILQRWREQWRVPRFVYVLEGEDRLLLDLEHVMMADLLRQELTRAEQAKRDLLLQEAFLPNLGAVRDEEGNSYVTEIVIPLVRKTMSSPPSLPCHPPEIISCSERRFLPGQAWISLKLYAPEDLQQTILTYSLPAFVQTNRPLFTHWFFLRFHDPQAHLRVRFYTPSEQQRAELFSALFAWSTALQQEGLLLRSCFDTYERETERYGGPEAIATIERVFCANSELVCTLLSEKEEAYPPLFDAVYTLDRLWSDWGYDLVARSRVLRDFLPAGKESQAVRNSRLELLAFLSHPPERFMRLFETQGTVLAQASQTFRQLAARGSLWRREEEVLWSLSHMLCNRLLGTQREQEQEVYRAWRLTLNIRSHTL